VASGQKQCLPSFLFNSFHFPRPSDCAFSLLEIITTIALTIMNDQEAFAIAVEEAKISFEEGGVPVNTPATVYNLEKSFQC
jgi:hypothetical protein